MISLKSAAMLIIVIVASLTLLVPLAVFTPPKDNEVWLFQTIAEMQGHQRYVPVLNNEPLYGKNPLTLTALTFLPTRHISIPRLISCALGCILVSCIFLYSLALFDLSSAFASSIVVMTTLGFLALFGTLNLIALPVVLAVSAFTLFSLAYVKHLNSGLYIISYILAALAAATGGYFLLLFILLAGLMLILLDLEPSKLFSIHLLTGLAIIGCSMTAYFLSYRFLLGPGFSGGAFSVGEHLGLFRSIYAIITYASPWVFLVIPAWLYGGGPSEQETWRKLLPSRIAIVMVFFMLWVSSSGLPQYATILMMFAAPLIGCWISRGIFFGSQKSTFGFWMMVLSGIVVFASALVLLLLPLRYGFALHAEQLIAGAGLLTATLLFIIFTVQRKMAAQFTLIVIAVVSVVGDLAFLSPEDQWDRKLSYMEGISINTPLVVYEDDLVMRGYMSRVNASPMIVDRDIVPFHGTAFIAVSTADLGGFLDGLKGRMRSVVLETYRAENTYALVMISPKKKGD